MPVFNNALAGAAGQTGGAAGYEISRSLRFNSADSANLSRTPSSAGNRRTWTWSSWVKRSKISTSTNHYLFSTANVAGNDYSSLYFDSSDDTLVFQGNNGSASVQFNLKTSAIFRDVSSWYHIVLSVDSTQSTLSDRIKLYVNGQQLDSFGTEVYPSQHFELRNNSINEHGIGKAPNFTTYFDGYLADVHFIDGQQLAATDFGEFDASTGAWNPIEYTGSHTTTGSTSGTLPNYNNNTSLPTYSDQDGNSGTPSVYQMENAFDGNSSTYANMTYLNGKWTRANFAQPITNVTRIDIGWDGEGDVGYNGSVVNSSVGYNGSRQSLTLYNNSGSPITLNNIHMVSQAGNGVCRLYDITITTTTQSATELTYSSVPAGPNGFHLDFSDNSSNAALGNDAAGSNNWTVNNIESGAPGNVNASGFVVTSGPAAGNNDANAIFDGNTATKSYSHGYGTHYVHVDTSSAPISCSSTDTLTIYWSTSTTNPRDADLQLEFSGGAVTTYSAFTRTSGTQNNTITIGTTGSIVDIRLGETSASNPGELHLHAIKLNGTFLVTTQEPDSLLDSPTNYDDGTNIGGNYCVLNPLSSTGTLSDGNLTGATGATTNYGTFAIPSSGSWYWECTIGGQNHNLGIAKYVPNAAQVYLINDSCLYSAAGVKNVDGVTDVAFGGSSSPGDIIGVLANADADTVTFYRNGTSIGSISHGVAGRFPVFGDGNVTEPASPVNFGQRPFAISSVPTGAKSLCTQNLPDPTIKDSSTAFDAHAYDGTGQAKTVSGLKLSPDLAWIKERDGTSWPRIIDAVRGQKEVFPNRNAQQSSFTQGLNQFTSDGFVLGTGTDSNVNTNNKDYIAWLWGGGSSFSNSAGSNGASVASSGKANTSAGFAVATFTSPASGNFSIAHGLNQAPEFVMVKTTGSSGDWTIFHKDVMSNTQQYLVLNNSNPLYTYNNIWGSGLPTSSVINMTSAGAVANGHTCVAYSFAPVEGFSAFGKYTGNSSQNFQHLGFQPRWIMIKNTSTSSYTAYTGWAMFDTERQPHNVNVNALWGNNSSDEGKRGNGSTASAPDFGIDIVSNGFTLRDNGASEINLNNETYVYAAFAEHPFKYARAR